MAHHWASLLDQSIRQGMFPGHVIAPGEAVCGVADKGQFKPLNVCEVHVLRRGVIAVVDPTHMHLGLGGSLMHHFQEDLMHVFT